MRPRFCPRSAVLPTTTIALLVFLFVSALARRAVAQTSSSDRAEEAWLTADQAGLEDRVADGDIDEEDLARLSSSAASLTAGSKREGASDVFAKTWVSLVGFSRPLASGTNELGGFVVVGLALDKIAQGRAHETRGSRDEREALLARSASLAEDTAPTPAPRPAPSTTALPPASRPLALDAALARGAVRTAWRVSGIEVNDRRIDEMIARSRLSVLLPETRIRAMQVFQDGEHSTSYINESGTVVDTSGSTTTLEARLTWRLDRLLFAGDEPTLERVRLEREEARGRIGGRVLELLFAWQRALLDEAAADAGSRAELDATLRQYEAEISLDVLTGGWFGAQPVVRARRQRP